MAGVGEPAARRRDPPLRPRRRVRDRPRRSPPRPRAASPPGSSRGRVSSMPSPRTDCSRRRSGASTRASRRRRSRSSCRRSGCRSCACPAVTSSSTPTRRSSSSSRMPPPASRSSCCAASSPDLPRPYRCWGYPVVPLLFVVATVALARQHPARAAEGDARGNRDPPARPAGVLRDAKAARKDGRVSSAGLRSAGFLLAGLALSAGPASEPSIAGFTPRRSAWQREYEKAAPRSPAAGGVRSDPARADAHAAHRRDGGQRPRRRVPGGRVPQGRAGRSRCRRTRCCCPIRRARCSRSSAIRRSRLARGELPIPEDPDTAVPEAAIPWNAYSPSAEVTGEVVYVNFGRAEDYERLARDGHRRPRQDRPRPLLRRLPRRQVARGREARRRSPSWSTPTPSRTAGFEGPVYPRGPVGTGLPLPARRERLRLPRARRSVDAGLGVHARRAAHPDGGGRDPAEDADDAALRAGRGRDPRPSRRSAPSRTPAGRGSPWPTRSGWGPGPSAST